MSNKDVNVVVLDDLDPDSFEKKTVGAKQVITLKEKQSRSIEVTKTELEVKKSLRVGNIAEILDDGVYVATETVQPVLNESSTQIVKSYISLVASHVQPSEQWQAQERAIIEHRNGLNILHLDISFKYAFNNQRDTHIANIPTSVPRFNSLTEVQVLGEGVDGYIYVLGNGSAVYAKGTFPANKRIVVKLIGYTR